MTPETTVLPRADARPHGAMRIRRLQRRLFRRALRLTGGREWLGTITHVITCNPVVALTFDDGPDPASTPRLLEVLARHQAKATFFMLGCQARRYPELVARIAQEGHAVANHSFDHPRMPSLPRSARRQQILDCAAATAPYGHKLFRPPRGLQSIPSRLDAAALGFEVVTWNVSAEDWEMRTPEWTAARLAAQAGPGSIVLLHDTLRDADRPEAADRTATFAGLDLYLAAAKTRFSFVTVPDLLTHGTPHRGLWLVRHDDDWVGHDPS